MLLECWVDQEDDDVGGLCITTAKNAADLRAKGLIAPNAVLAYTIEANTWREAMEEHHKRQGWGPYNPPADWPVDEPLEDMQERIDAVNKEH